MDIKYIKIYCKERKLYPLIYMNKDTQSFFYQASRVCIKLGKEKNDIPREVLTFFRVFPVNYKPMIAHDSNSCWIASSIWFFSSQRLLLNMLNVYDKRLRPIILNITKKMIVSTSEDNRKYAFKKDDIVKECLMEKLGYKGEQDDVTRNWYIILDNIPDIIRKQLYIYSTEKVTTKILEKTGAEISVEKDSVIYNGFVNKYNKLLKDIELSLGKQVKKQKLIEILPSKVPEQIYFEAPNFSSNFWEKAYLIITGKKKTDIKTVERFCGKIKGFKVINQKICDLYYILKEIKIIQNLYKKYIRDDNTEEKLKHYGYKIPVDKHRSISDYFKELFNNDSEDIIERYNSFDVLYTKKITHSIKDKPYVTIHLIYNLEDNNYKIPSDFKVDNFIYIEDMLYILTSVCMKSGNLGSGHWTCLIKDIKENNFVEYNDIRNDTLRRRDIDFINKFNAKTGIPVLLVYTKYRPF